MLLSLGFLLLFATSAQEPCKVSSVKYLNQTCVIPPHGGKFRPKEAAIQSFILLDALILEKTDFGPFTLGVVLDKEATDKRMARDRVGRLPDPRPGLTGVHRHINLQELKKGTAGIKLDCAKDIENFPNACSGTFEVIVKWAYENSGTYHSPVTFGMGLYMFSTYDEKRDTTRRVLQIHYVLGSPRDGTCWVEYKVDEAPDHNCFGLLADAGPAADPPKPRSVGIPPGLPEVHAKFQITTTSTTTSLPGKDGTGMGTGTVIAIVFVILILVALAGGIVFYLGRQRATQAELGLRNAQEVELS